MKKANGTVFKYGDNVDTDVIIPARYLNSSDPAELAQHCMEDIDKDFVNNVKKGHPDIKIFVGNLDRELNERAYICPGLGDAGDRIFGTR